MSAISTVSSDVVVDVDRPTTMIAGSTPLEFGDRRPAVLIWGSSRRTAIPKLPIKGVVNTAIAVPTWGTVGTPHGSCPYDGTWTGARG